MIITKNNSFDSTSMFLKIATNKTKNFDVKEIIEILNKDCSKAKLKRLDETDKLFEASFLVEYTSYRGIIETKEKLNKLNNELNYTFIDNNNIF